MIFDIRKIDLDKFDTMTKYPSIETYHKLEGKGIPSATIQVDFSGEQLFLTEKVDGCNARMVFCPDQNVLVGSRDEFLWARGDLIPNPKLGLVATVRDYVDRNYQRICKPDRIIVVTVEIYGKLPGRTCKRYGMGESAFRVFDVIQMELDLVYKILAKPIEQIASWRDNGGQSYLSYPLYLPQYVQELGIPMVPSIGWNQSLHSQFPKERAEVLALLRSLQGSVVKEYAGKPEGIVARTHDRKKIAKMRLEEYERWEKTNDHR